MRFEDLSEFVGLIYDAGAGVISRLYGRLLGADADLALGRAAGADPAQQQARGPRSSGTLREGFRSARYRTGLQARKCFRSVVPAKSRLGAIGPITPRAIGRLGSAALRRFLDA